MVKNGNGRAVAVRVVCDDCGAERWYIRAHIRFLETNGRCRRCITIERNKSEQGRAASSRVGSYKRTNRIRKKQSDSARSHWTPEMRKTREREGNPAWTGGRVYHSGYIFILMPEHPRANNRGYVAEHILVAEKKLGRPILRGEVVHHDNEIKDDNRPENLIVMTPEEHMRIHHQRRGLVRQCSK